MDVPDPVSGLLIPERQPTFLLSLPKVLTAEAVVSICEHHWLHGGTRVN